MLRDNGEVTVMLIARVFSCRSGVFVNRRHCMDEGSLTRGCIGYTPLHGLLKIH